MDACGRGVNKGGILIMPIFSEKTNSTDLTKSALQGGEGKDVLTASAMVGSRPPRCARMCLKCAHCEAVQVPAIPQQIGAAAHTSMNIDARGDDKSNYKPMKWKCKCGNFLFNP
ncbi:hypothetical protein HPP92_014016 [Vanilla planifolia]|uniref:Epidermal patterning factor-like protein n=1 Tax=Vanilla planifolia TaxID=51239 RepID=A0A835UYJ1_VANPL|nr:hypothetical protein HPP92_014016 [Vanilla planifolia]